MQAFVEAATILLPLAYLLVAIDYGFLFFAAAPFAARTAAPALRVTVLFHLAALAAATLLWRRAPIHGAWQALSGAGFAVAVVCAAMNGQGRTRRAAFWLVSLVFVCQLSSLLVRPDPPRQDVIHDHFGFGD